MQEVNWRVYRSIVPQVYLCKSLLLRIRKRVIQASLIIRWGLPRLAQYERLAVRSYLRRRGPTRIMPP